ncbi:MAG TPA: DUF4845 domain-containing protein [Fluviicoccus sp.]|nr:DUF4845 domain-containing protein [Fluviicoccus sp.]
MINRKVKKMRNLQRGMSYWGVVVGISLFVLILKLGIVIGPMYMDYMTLNQMISGMFKESDVDGKTIESITNGISSRMDMNNIRDRKVEDIMTIRREGNIFVVVLDYEDRKQIFGNLDVVTHFRKTYSSEHPDGIKDEAAPDSGK